MRILPGRKRVVCLACEHEQILGLRDAVGRAKCENCCSKFLQALEARPSMIHGVGSNAVADLGLALLLQAQTDDNTYEPKKKK